MAPSSSSSTQKQSPAILLKAKGGKAFGALASLTDDSSLQLTWKVYNKVGTYSDQGQRIENLSWRLWHLRDVMVSEKGNPLKQITTGKESEEERCFNALSASLANKLESDRKTSINKLSAPEFRWTDSNDALRHKAIMRTRKRELIATKKHGGKDLKSKVHLSPTELSNASHLTKKDIRQILGPTNRRRSHESTIEESHRASLSPTSSSSSSSSSSISFVPAPRTLRMVKQNDSNSQNQQNSISNSSTSQTSRRTSSPPVCWRLTREQAMRQHKAKDASISPPLTRPMSEKAAGKQRQELKTTWTVQEIEDAERELKEQGVELSGPFLAMLTDLKTGELAKVNQADENEYEEDEDEQQSELEDEMDEENVNEDKITAKHEEVEFDSQRPAPKTPTVPSLHQSGTSLPATPTTHSATFGRRSSTASEREHTLAISTKEETYTDDAVLQNELDPQDDKDGNLKRPKPQCVNCGATKTPLWRRDANFELQCNACGLYEKLHKAPRPKALKQRRNERRQKNAESPENGPGSGILTSSISPQSEFSNQKDEWMGIHAGATCANCGTSTTPLWRKDREGRIICNACGLYYKLHNSHRPVTMRMDAIKRRSRYDDRRRTDSIAGGSISVGAGTPNRIMTDEELMSKIFEDGTSSMLIQNSIQHHSNTMPNTPDTPHTLINNPFFHDAAAMSNPNQMPLQEQMQPFQIQQFHSTDHAGQPIAPNSIPLSGGHHHQHHQHPHNGLAPHAMAMSHSHSMHDGIHIPSVLWENQVCPMGAWGENCCQNLPQPTSHDLQSALMAAGSSDAPAADQSAVTAAMDALLNHGDWISDFAAKPVSASDQVQVISHNSQAGTPSPATQNVFNPAEVTSDTIGMINQTVVGPSYPLKRRKLNSSNPTKSPGNLENTNSPSTNIVIPTPMSTTGSNAATPANDWWSFPGSPSIKQ